MKTTKKAKLILKGGYEQEGISFGFTDSVAGEVVFNTSLVGYPEALSDPSYRGQILVLTYPLIGNYGVPKMLKYFESKKPQISALVVSSHCEKPSHYQFAQSLAKWLKQNKVPAIAGIDTRALTKRLRESGSSLGKIIIKNDIDFFDPNKENLQLAVSCSKKKTHGQGKKKVLLIDCGVKKSIITELLNRNCQIIQAPYDYNFLNETYDGILISNGPGNPKMCKDTISHLKRAIKQDKPIFGICLGNQLLALAAGADTYKLKYGHHSSNQPCLNLKTGRCYITSQNHGYAVDEKSLPKNFKPWFKNANDGTNEGIRHIKKPIFSVQFHPEANPGPEDTSWLFDEFIEKIQ